MSEKTTLEDPAVASALEAALATLPGGGNAATTGTGEEGKAGGETGDGASAAPEAKSESQIPELTPQHIAIIDTIHGLGEGRTGAMDAFLAQVAVAQGKTVEQMMGEHGFTRGKAEVPVIEDEPEPEPGKDLDDMDGKELNAYLKARDAWRERKFEKKLAAVQSEVQAAKQPVLDAQAQQEAALKAVKTAERNHPTIKAAIAKDFAGYEVTVRDIAEAAMRYPNQPIDEATRLHMFPKLSKHAMGVVGQKGQVPDMTKQGKKQVAEPDWEKDPVAAAQAYAAQITQAG